MALSQCPYKQSSVLFDCVYQDGASQSVVLGSMSLSLLKVDFHRRLIFTCVRT